MTDEKTTSMLGRFKREYVERSTTGLMTTRLHDLRTLGCSDSEIEALDALIEKRKLAN